MPTYIGSERLDAVVDYGIWSSDRSSVSIVKCVTFDCRKALDEIAIEELPKTVDGFLDGACDYGRDVYLAAVKLGIVQGWTEGPVNCSIVHGDAYRGYVLMRRKHNAYLRHARMGSRR